jgi:hypothetical protein
MSEFTEENSRDVTIDISPLICKLPEIEFTYGPERFGVGMHLNIEYYERLFEQKHPGLLNQFPCLYYMVEEWFEEATKLTPLEHIEARKK